MDNVFSLERNCRDCDPIYSRWTLTFDGALQLQFSMLMLISFCSEWIHSRFLLGIRLAGFDCSSLSLNIVVHLITQHLNCNSHEQMQLCFTLQSLLIIHVDAESLIQQSQPNVRPSTANPHNYSTGKRSLFLQMTRSCLHA